MVLMVVPFAFLHLKPIVDAPSHFLSFSRFQYLFAYIRAALHVLFYHDVLFFHIFLPTFNINAIFHRFCLVACVNLNDNQCTEGKKNTHKLVNKTPSGTFFSLPPILNAIFISFVRSFVHFYFEISHFCKTNRKNNSNKNNNTRARTVFLLQREKGGNM